MASYWYSTDGLDQKRLSSAYLDVLDRAYEMRTRVEIFDDQVFGPRVAAVADPFLGTMTAGGIHYGLYRNPTLHRMSDRSSSIDTLILFDSTSSILQQKEEEQQQQQQEELVTPQSSLPSSSPSTPNCYIDKSEDCVLVASHHLLGKQRSSSRSNRLTVPSSLTTAGADQQHVLRTSPPQSQEECVCCIIS